MPLAITCRNVGHRYGVFDVLRDVCWHVPPGTCVALVGRSGAGKTTLLRLLAGLEPPCRGEICFEQAGPASGTVSEGSADAPIVASARQPRPRVGMVFQSLGLWPHLTAREHLACITQGTRAARMAQVENLLREVNLPETLWDRLPAALSGGEAQRLALARALAGDPQILLLDEPLAQVDGPLRAELAELVRSVVQRRQATCVYVTHHGQEAMEIGSRVAVLERGTLIQEGPVEAVYWRPVSAEAARLTGPVVELPKQLWPDAVHPAAAEGVLDCGQNLLVRPQRLDLIEAEPCSQPDAAGGERTGGPVLQVAWCRPHGCGWQVALHSPRLLLWSRTSWPAGATVRLCILPATNSRENMYDKDSRLPHIRPQHPAEPPG